MKFIIPAVAALALGATSVDAEFTSGAPEMKFLWHSWKQIHNKVYAESQEIQKFTTFVENYFMIVAHNAKNSGHKLGLNQFADLTDEEFKAEHALGLIRKNRKENNGFHVDYSILDLPESVDWRTKGAVTPVKNQGKCGSCWAFSSVGALEGHNFIKTGKLLSFAEQQLVDCDKIDGGCNGGMMEDAIDYAGKNGIMVEDDYPYTAQDGQCKFDAKKAHKVNKGHKNLDVSPAGLKAGIAVQPVAVSVRADQAAFRFYKSGVVKANCGADLNHGVLGVGYGVFDGEEAVIIKNSWGETWGNKGFVYVSLDKDANDGQGVCGILAENTVPTD
jgi:C1A family cysteine protease